MSLFARQCNKAILFYYSPQTLSLGFDSALVCREAGVSVTLLGSLGLWAATAKGPGLQALPLLLH